MAAELAKEDAFIRESRRRQQEALEAETRRHAEADAKVMNWRVFLIIIHFSQLGEKPNFK